jgi:hypothetical protein
MSQVRLVDLMHAPADMVNQMTALWSHFGEYGDQDAHFHVCFKGGCHAMLVGKGRTCGKGQKHTVKK